MSRANPFGDLDDFSPQPVSKPVLNEAIEEISKASGFLSRKASEPVKKVEAQLSTASVVARAPRRRTTGRNRQINIKATEETIEQLYKIADDLDMPLGAVLERALNALENQGK